jgi:hypothetical protein
VGEIHKQEESNPRGYLNDDEGQEQAPVVSFGLPTQVSYLILKPVDMLTITFELVSSLTKHSRSHVAKLLALLVLDLSQVED